MTSDELKQAIQALPPLPATAPRHSWLRHRIDLRKRILRDNPEEFLTWPVIQGTMFVGNANYIKDELDYLRGVWVSNKWTDILGCPGFGKSKKGIFCSNLLHQAYHLKQWEDKTGLRVEDQSRIIEFGGGYGAMALICRRLGFDGHYAIWDLPEFSLLQEFYLSNVLDDISDITISPVLYDINCDVDLFIALWSISEIDPGDRYIPEANSYLFAYAPTWGSYDNQACFDKFIEDKLNYKWWDWTIPHLPNFKYLIGVKAGVSI